MDLLKSHLNKNVESAQWLLWQFSHPKVLTEFLFECCEGEIRRLVAGLLYCAALKVFASEKVSGTILTNFVNAMFHQLPTCRKYTIYFEQYFQVFARLAFLGPEIREYLLAKAGAIKRLLGFWGNFTEAGWLDFTDLPFKENEAPN
jgi:hypothetical protein